MFGLLSFCSPSRLTGLSIFAGLADDDKEDDDDSDDESDNGDKEDEEDQEHEHILAVLNFFLGTVGTVKVSRSRQHIREAHRTNAEGLLHEAKDYWRRLDSF
jgi:ABC-type Zn2+ transport system substrate-binding protein/surface adhesin